MLDPDELAATSLEIASKIDSVATAMSNVLHRMDQTGDFSSRRRIYDSLQEATRLLLAAENRVLRAVSIDSWVSEGEEKKT